MSSAYILGPSLVSKLETHLSQAISNAEKLETLRTKMIQAGDTNGLLDPMTLEAKNAYTTAVENQISELQGTLKFADTHGWV